MPPEPRMAGVAAYAGLTGRARERAEAKLAVLDAWRTFQQGSSLGRKAAARVFSDLFNRGEITVDPWVRGVVRRLKARTLEHWDTRERRDGPVALAGLAFGRHLIGTGKIDSDPALRDSILGLLGTHPDWSAAHIYAALEARAAGAPLPVLRTVQKWIARWRADHPQLAIYLSDPDAWRHRHLPAAGSASEAVTRLNQLWELDSTPADVMLQGGRHAVVGVIDVYSRRAMVQVSKTSRSTAIAALLRRAILAWGVPEEIKTDNGKDYVSRHIREITGALSLRHTTCPPYTPDAKSHIERFFGTFSRGLLPLLPGYIGPDVARRKSIRARKAAGKREGQPIRLKLTAAELQRECDRWCDSVYSRKPHRGGGMNGKSPFQEAADWAGPVRRVPDPRALDVALAPPAVGGGVRMVRRGVVSVDNREYAAPELGAHSGERVYVKVDEADLGHVYLFQRNAFLCIAECAALTGVARTELAARVKSATRAMLREAKADIRRKARETAASGAGRAILDHAEAGATRVAAFPQPGEPYATPELEQASVAAAAKPAGGARRAESDEEELRRRGDTSLMGKWAREERARKQAANDG